MKEQKAVEIVDIHPDDSRFVDKDKLIGSTGFWISNVKEEFNVPPLHSGFEQGQFKVTNPYMGKIYFLAIKTRPIKGKVKYRATINWSGEIHTLYRWATTPSHARSILFRALANKLKVTSRYVYIKLLNTDKYKIERIET